MLEMVAVGDAYSGPPLEKAVVRHRRVVAVYEAHFPASPRFAEAVMRLVDVLLGEKLWAECDETFKKYEVVLSGDAKRRLKWAQALELLGNESRLAGAHEKSMKTYARAAEQAHLGGDERYEIGYLCRMAVERWRIGERDEAEKDFMDLVRRCIERGYERDWPMASAMDNFAFCLSMDTMDVSAQTRAIDLLAVAVSIRREIRSPHLGASLINRARAYLYLAEHGPIEGREAMRRGAKANAQAALEDTTDDAVVRSARAVLRRVS